MTWRLRTNTDSHSPAALVSSFHFLTRPRRESEKAISRHSSIGLPRLCCIALAELYLTGLSALLFLCSTGIYVLHFIRKVGNGHRDDSVTAFSQILSLPTPGFR